MATSPAPSSTRSQASSEVSAHLSPAQTSLAKAIDAVVNRLRSEHGALVRTPSKPGDASRKELKQTVRDLVKEMRQSGDIERKVSAQPVINGAISESVGWGPIEELLEDQDVTAIVANGADNAFPNVVRLSKDIPKDDNHKIAINTYFESECKYCCKDGNTDSGDEDNGCDND